LINPAPKTIKLKFAKSCSCSILCYSTKFYFAGISHCKKDICEEILNKNLFEIFFLFSGRLGHKVSPL
jgi:hypothetical protein